MEEIGSPWLSLSDLASKALGDGQIAGLPLLQSLDQAKAIPDRWNQKERLLLDRNITAGLARYDMPPPARASLDRLRQPGTLAIVTGQQPGFLSAPLYSLIKAMQACRLAEELSATMDRPVVPIFWNHADDHDIAEVHHSYIQNRNLDLQKVGLAGLSSGRQPLSRIPIDRDAQGLGAIEALLEQNFGMYPFCTKALELFFPKGGETLPNATTRAFLELLGPMGLIPVEPDWIREPLGIALAGTLNDETLGALKSGTEIGSIDATTAALLFRVDETGRSALRMQGETFVEDQSGQTWTPSELSAAVRANPHAWSAGALLRPLAQDRALPCLAYVGGMGELAYHAQVVELRTVTDTPQTYFVPRVSMTMVDEECTASLKKSGLSLGHILEAKGEWNPPEEDNAPPQVIADVQAIVAEAQQKLRDKRGELAEIEPSLANGLRRATDQMGQGIEKLLSKATRMHQNKGGNEKRHIKRLNNRLMPRGLPQERVLGPLEFYSRYGPDWVTGLYHSTPPLMGPLMGPSSASHLAITLSMPPNDHPAKSGSESKAPKA